jgi:hypothetical protein
VLQRLRLLQVLLLLVLGLLSLPLGLPGGPSHGRGGGLRSSSGGRATGSTTDSATASSRRRRVRARLALHCRRRRRHRLALGSALRTGLLWLCPGPGCHQRALRLSRALACRLLAGPEDLGVALAVEDDELAGRGQRRVRPDEAPDRGRVRRRRRRLACAAPAADGALRGCVVLRCGGVGWDCEGPRVRDTGSSIAMYPSQLPSRTRRRSHPSIGY